MDFQEIIEKNKTNVKNIIKMITKEENEDLEQEVYIKAWKNSDKYKEQGSFKSWINTIAKNVSKDYLKSSAKKQQQNSDSDEYSLSLIQDNKPTPELKVIKNERQAKIIEAVNSLKPKLRDVIIYSEMMGYTYEECAKKFNCPIGTIKSRVYNAKQELAVLLADLMKG